MCGLVLVGRALGIALPPLPTFTLKVNGNFFGG
jgi:hypothetical protein